MVTLGTQDVACRRWEENLPDAGRCISVNDRSRTAPALLSRAFLLSHIESRKLNFTAAGSPAR